MKPDFKQKIEETCNQFPFVTWDRFVEWPDWKDGLGVTVSGWIEREDQYKDYMVLDFFDDGTVEYMTSSAKYSQEIWNMLYGINLASKHTDCKRVEDHFKGIIKSIKL